VIETCFSGSSSEYVVKDCLAVGQAIDDGLDERVILFVELPQGKMLSSDFEKAIKAEIRARRSPRHVPSKVRLLRAPLQHVCLGFC
jgi:acetoacetyl-CoA synthetase